MLLRQLGSRDLLSWGDGDHSHQFQDAYWVVCSTYHTILFNFRTSPERMTDSTSFYSDSSVLFMNQLQLDESNPPQRAWVRHRHYLKTRGNRSTISVQQAPMKSRDEYILSWRSLFSEGDSQQASFPFGRYQVSFWTSLSCHWFVLKILRACATAVPSHLSNIPNWSRSSDPES